LPDFESPFCAGALLVGPNNDPVRYRTSIPWRDLPERFGEWKNVHRRFSRWAETGVWERVFKQLVEDADNEYATIDSTVVRAHQHSAGAQKKTAKTKRSDGRAGD
jgi:transposase